MEREHKTMVRPVLRYPLFLVGLLILVVGGLLAVHFGAGTDAEVVIAAAGFLLLVFSVALR